MDTTTRLTSGIALVIAVLLVGAMAPAAAKPGGKPGKPQPAPACRDEVALSGSGNLDLTCNWTPRETADIGSVTVQVTDGQIRYLAIAVRDSSPGDYCAGPAIWDGRYNAESTFAVTFDLVRDGSAYWATPIDWCGQQRTDTNGEPLAITVHARAKRGTELLVTFDPPQAP